MMCKAAKGFEHMFIKNSIVLEIGDWVNLTIEWPEADDQKLLYVKLKSKIRGAKQNR